MGAGHNATAWAVEQTARRVWPGCESRWVDTLDLMGFWVGPTFRRLYVTNVQTTPWLYEFFYRSLWRYRWFADASRRFVGTWSGRRLRRVVRDYGPDLIISTYPLGSAGLAWLRRHRGLDVPAVAWVSDFAPHPFWIYRDLDLHYVMHQVCVPRAHAAEPGSEVLVGAPAVADGFVPADRDESRGAVGLRMDAFVALLSCGYFGFGTVEKAVDTLLAADPRVQVVAVCGHNDRLRERLTARGVGSDRLLPLGWVDTMPTYMAAADVIVTNAGGATSLEALACGRPVVMFEPIAAHGRANAELMADTGLALLCRTPEELEGMVRTLLDQPERLTELESRVLTHARARTRDDDVRALTRLPHRGRGPLRREKVRAEDAFFLYAETDAVSQILGGVAIFEQAIGLDDVIAKVGDGLADMPAFRRRLVHARSRLRRPRWAVDHALDVRRHVTERVLGTDGEPQSFEDLVDDFFSTPLDLGRAPWEITIVQGLDGGRSAGLMKLHHAIGDGFSIPEALGAILDGNPHANGGPRRSSSAVRISGSARSHGLGDRVRRAAGVVGGVWQLASNGTAPRTSVNGQLSGPKRRCATVRLPGAEVRRAARLLDVGTSDLVLAVLGDALHRLLIDRGEDTEGRTLRFMVPRTSRTAANWRSPGNDTAAVSVDVPIGAIDPRVRLAGVRSAVTRQVDRGAPEGARFVMHIMGALPAAIHARVARTIYSSRFFNLIVSVIPGPRRPRYFNGIRLVEAYPVIPVADRVGLAIGVMPWGEAVGVGITADATLVPDISRLVSAVEESFAEFRAVAQE